MPDTIEQPNEVTRDGLASVAEACDFLSISRTSLYKMMDAGELKFVKLPGLSARRIAWRVLEELVK